MSHELEQLRDAALAEIAATTDEQTLETVRIRYIGRAGSISAWADQMKSLSKEERPIVGKLLNVARTAVTAAIQQNAERLRTTKEASELANIDISLPGTAAELGTLHPLTQMLDRGIGIFRRMGFALAEGPDVETEWHCFDALNTPPDHPARNEQDTFYLPDGRVLRTHTRWKARRRRFASSLPAPPTAATKWMPPTVPSFTRSKAFTSMKMSASR